MHLTNILAVLTALTVSSVALPNPEPNDRPGKETQQTCFEKCRKDGNLSVCWEKCHSKPPAINFETGAKHRRQNDPPKDGHRFVYAEFYRQKNFKELYDEIENLGDCVHYFDSAGPRLVPRSSFPAHSIKLHRKAGSPAVKCQLWTELDCQGTTFTAYHDVSDIDKESGHTGNWTSWKCTECGQGDNCNPPASVKTRRDDVVKTDDLIRRHPDDTQAPKYSYANFWAELHFGGGYRSSAPNGQCSQFRWPKNGPPKPFPAKSIQLVVPEGNNPIKCQIWTETECKGQSFTTSEDVEDLPKASGHSGDWRSAKCWEEAKPSRREAVMQDLDTRGLSMFEAALIKLYVDTDFHGRPQMSQLVWPDDGATCFSEDDKHSFPGEEVKSIRIGRFGGPKLNCRFCSETDCKGRCLTVSDDMADIRKEKDYPGHVASFKCSKVD